MVFYFTGTGNSMYAAQALEDDARSIPQVMRGNERSFRAETIGIVSPIYGHELPGMVRRFIREAAFQTEYFYLILTYGRRHANAVELAEAELRAAGKQADYIATLWMVDNFLPVFDMEKERSLERPVDARLREIRSDIAKRRRRIEPVTAEDRAQHREFLRRMEDRTGGKPFEQYWSDFRVTDACIGCGICVGVCPAGCITLDGQRAVHIGSGCQTCYACVHACPEMAIRFNYPEKNPNARYRNEHISLSQIVRANHQN